MSDQQLRTFRGRSLAEVLPRIREELGEHAVAVRVRHGRTGGVGGFFAQRCVEVDARPGSRFDSALAQAQVSTERFVSAEVPSDWQELVERAPEPPAEQPSVGEILGERRARTGASALAALFQPDAAPPAAEPQPDPQRELQAAGFEPEPFEPDPLPVPAPRVERGVVHAAAPAPVLARAPMVPVDPSWPDTAVAVHHALTGKGMDPELVAEIVGEAVDHLLPFSSAGSLRPLVAGQLARCLPPVPRRRPGGLTIGFVGAGGSGKTRCTARLALAYANCGGRPVACLTLRPKDRGVELMTDVSAAGVAVHATDDVADARRFLDRVGENAIVVVDTPGVSPRAEAELRRLAAELRQLQLDECHLTLPATMSPVAAEELVRGTRSLGVDALAITHVDETEHLGTAIGAAIDADLPISYVGRGPDARGTLRPALVQALALELVG